jgi:hypothetical protein
MPRLNSLFLAVFTLANSVILQCDIALLTCLAHLGQCDTDRIISIYVTPPKVAKASTVVTVT